VAPFPPGSGADVVGRIYAPKFHESLGRQFVIDTRPGAAGSLAAKLVADATPDGYTLLVLVASIASGQPLYKDLAFDVARDFQPAGMLAVGSYLLVVNASVSVQNLKDLIALAKANPGKLNYASGGSGVTNHLVTEMFKAAAGIDMQHVPYKGGPAALTDLVGGQVDVMFETMVATLPLVKGGKLRAIAVSSANRAAAAPELPTISESGYPGFTGVPWVAMAAPIKTPRAIVAALNADINRILAAPDVREGFIASGSEPMIMNLAELDAFVKAETQKWGRAVKASGAKVD
jgi:tripartite-type tricarboxylate transporter receptor subunit TctC